MAGLKMAVVARSSKTNGVDKIEDDGLALSGSIFSLLLGDLAGVVFDGLESNGSELNGFESAGFASNGLFSDDTSDDV
jgi:hypothetical protein